MRIQLIHPPVYQNPRAIQATRPSLPIGLAYVAAALREAGHEVSVLDAVQRAPERWTRDGSLVYLGLGPEEIAAAVDPKADAAGLSVMFSFTWPLAREIARAIKARHPGITLVGGGEHFTGMPEASLRSAPLDFLALGEGEATAAALFGALEAGSSPETVAGLAYLSGKRFVRTAPRPRIRDVDALPRPAWDLFDVRAYYRQGHVFGVDAGMTMPVLATRGCPYACTYCSNPMMWGREWRARDPESVAAEIEDYHREYGATNFPFHDLTAILRKEWIVAFCHALMRRDLRITWQLPSGTRCEAIDEEVAALLRRTGGSSLTFAPESGSAAVRERIQKRMSDVALTRAVRASVRQGLNVSVFFVAGFPGDTARDLWASVWLAHRLARMGVNDLALSVFFPIPGTALYAELEAAGRITGADADLLAPIHSMDARVRPAYNYCEGVSAGRLTAMKYAILAAFYTTSFAVRPWRAFQIAWNVFRERESCKLDIFLIARKRRLFGRSRPPGAGAETQEAGGA